MLQLKTAGYRALCNLQSRREYPPRWKTMEELEQVTDRFLELFLDERQHVAQKIGLKYLLPELVDRTIRTCGTEYMDRPELGEHRRHQLVHALHRMNSMIMLYPRHIGILEPLIKELSCRSAKPVRMLELASGSGGLAMAIADHARKKGVELAVTASDIVPEFVSEGNRIAAERSLPVEFHLINAFDHHGFGKGEFDLVIMSQSLHHFSPGQLAMMIARIQEDAPAVFVGFDGYRSMPLLAGVPLVASLLGNGALVHDGFLSARKFYSGIELDIISTIATGRSAHHIGCSWPMTILRINFDNSKT